MVFLRASETLAGIGIYYKITKKIPFKSDDVLAIPPQFPPQFPTFWVQSRQARQAHPAHSFRQSRPTFGCPARQGCLRLPFDTCQKPFSARLSVPGCQGSIFYIKAVVFFDKKKISGPNPMLVHKPQLGVRAKIKNPSRCQTSRQNFPPNVLRQREGFFILALTPS